MAILCIVLLETLYSWAVPVPQYNNMVVGTAQVVGSHVFIHKIPVLYAATWEQIQLAKLVHVERGGIPG